MRYAFAFLLVACGPSVTENDDDGGTTSGASTTDATATTVATSVTTTASTSTATSATATTMTSSADESTSSDTSGDDGETDDGMFVTKPDGGECFNVCIECDVWAQDCQENEKCMAWANDGGDVWNAHRCTPVLEETAAIGEPCVVEGSGVSGIDDCDHGAICWGVDPLTNEGTCVPMCTGSEVNPICPDGLACTIAFDGTLIVCEPPCEPLASTCAADEVCSSLDSYPTSDTRFACQPMPPFEPQPYGSACGGLQICDAGLLCVPADQVPGCADLGCCTQLGDSDAPGPCPDATQSCIPLGEPNAGFCYCGVP